MPLDAVTTLVETYPLETTRQLLQYVQNDLLSVPRTKVDKLRTKFSYEDTVRFLQRVVHAGGSVTVKYFYGKGREDGRQFGRGAQGLRSSFRATILSDDWIDIDIVNCAPTILNALAQSHIPNQPLRTLNALVEDRDGLFERIRGDTGLTRAEIKEKVMRALMDHHKKGRDFGSPELNILNSEAAILAEALKNTDFGDLLPFAKPNSGSFLSLVYQTVEDDAVVAAVDWCKFHNIAVHSLIFDGFIASGQTPINFEAMNAHVQNATNFPVRFVQKPWENMITDLPEAPPFDPNTPIPPPLYEDLWRQKHCDYVKVGDVVYNPKQPRADPMTFKKLFEVRSQDMCRLDDGGALRNFWKEWVQDGRQNYIAKTGAYPYPNPEDCPVDHFNTWEPLPYEGVVREPNREYIAMITAFLRLLTGNHEDSYIFFTNFLAHMVQRTEDKPSVAPCFITPEGAGKDFMIKSLRLALGDDRVWAPTMEELAENFCGRLPEALLVMANEATLKAFKAMKGKLYTLISDERINFNRKFGAQWESQSIHRVIVASNEKASIPVSGGTRRFKVMTSDHVLTSKADFPWHEYISAYQDDKEEWGYAWWFFMRHEIKAPTHMSKYEMGEASHFEKTLRGMNIPPFERWLHYKLKTGDATETKYLLPGGFEALAKEARAWCESQHLSSVPTVGEFVVELRTLHTRPEVSKRNNIGSVQGWRIDRKLIEEKWERDGFKEEGCDIFDIHTDESMEQFAEADGY